MADNLVRRSQYALNNENLFLENWEHSLQAANVRSGRPTDSMGVFAAQPFSSPKYLRHAGGDRHHEYFDTMARMFIKLYSKRQYEKTLEGMYGYTKEVFSVLAGTNKLDEKENSAVGEGGVGYIDFLLQGVTQVLTEKVQISETLSDNYVSYFFGQSAPTWNFQGTLLNTFQDDWTVRMYALFNFLGRGTKLARRQQILRIKYDSFIVSGAMTNLQWSLQAANEMACPFSFNFLVKSIQVFGDSWAPPTTVPSLNLFHDGRLKSGSSAVNVTKGMATPNTPPAATNKTKQTKQGNALDGNNKGSNAKIDKNAVKRETERNKAAAAKKAGTPVETKQKTTGAKTTVPPPNVAGAYGAASVEAKNAALTEAERRQKEANQKPLPTAHGESKG